MFTSYSFDIGEESSGNYTSMLYVNARANPLTSTPQIGLIRGNIPNTANTYGSVNMYITGKWK